MMSALRKNHHLRYRSHEKFGTRNNLYHPCLDEVSCRDSNSVLYCLRGRLQLLGTSCQQYINKHAPPNQERPCSTALSACRATTMDQRISCIDALDKEGFLDSKCKSRIIAIKNNMPCRSWMYSICGPDMTLKDRYLCALNYLRINRVNVPPEPCLTHFMKEATVLPCAMERINLCANEFNLDMIMACLVYNLKTNPDSISDVCQKRIRSILYNGAPPFTPLDLLESTWFDLLDSSANLNTAVYPSPKWQPIRGIFVPANLGVMIMSCPLPFYYDMEKDQCEPRPSFKGGECSTSIEWASLISGSDLNCVCLDPMCVYPTPIAVSVPQRGKLKPSMLDGTYDKKRVTDRIIDGQIQGGSILRNACAYSGIQCTVGKLNCWKKLGSSSNQITAACSQHITNQIQDRPCANIISGCRSDILEEKLTCVENTISKNPSIADSKCINTINAMKDQMPCRNVFRAICGDFGSFAERLNCAIGLMNQNGFPWPPKCYPQLQLYQLKDGCSADRMKYCPDQSNIAEITYTLSNTQTGSISLAAACRTLLRGFSLNSQSLIGSTSLNLIDDSGNTEFPPIIRNSDIEQLACPRPFKIKSGFCIVPEPFGYWCPLPLRFNFTSKKCGCLEGTTGENSCTFPSPVVIPKPKTETKKAAADSAVQLYHSCQYDVARLCNGSVAPLNCLRNRNGLLSLMCYKYLTVHGQPVCDDFVEKYKCGIYWRSPVALIDCLEDNSIINGISKACSKYISKVKSQLSCFTWSRYYCPSAPLPDRVQCIKRLLQSNLFIEVPTRCLKQIENVETDACAYERVNYLSTETEVGAITVGLLNILSRNRSMISMRCQFRLALLQTSIVEGSSNSLPFGVLFTPDDFIDSTEDDLFSDRSSVITNTDYENPYEYYDDYDDGLSVGVGWITMILSIVVCFFIINM
eukprot:NODE_58_length_4113_cov_58.773434_g48_i0.p1 GENE.NODE_58_length_4113_cov_58.773434_g48_i0~~NODE_58_length_4113_cov_58.773434_g48_i0.p1  ORF type:complete len:920 (+),score=135.85 NODE_58_length_4113_cov_58.773434_g48_i0:1090-3849(+)